MKRAVVFLFLVAITVLLCSHPGCRNPFCPRDEEPYVVIDRPPPAGGIQVLPRIITFGWHSGLDEDPRAVRHMWSLVVDTNGVYNPTFDIVRDLNENPWRYEDKWSRWVFYSAPHERGRKTILGDDEPLEVNKSHIFAVQAMDRCGRVTETFRLNVNVRKFIVSKVAGPLLTVMEPFLGYFKFLGTNMGPERIDLPPGVPLNFRWRADASSYGGEIVSYRYGWDITDLNDPNQWDVPPSPHHVQAPEQRFYAGIHTFYVETVDNAGSATLASIQLTIVPFPMDRELLWVDDFLGTPVQDPNYSHPSETNHDQFWTGICDRATGFDPASDIYDCAEHNYEPPDLATIGMYKNIIWTYASYQYGAWKKVVYFTPESRVGQGIQRRLNYLPVFLVKGGHLWTLGRSERESGLAAVLSPDAQIFPLSLRCEITGPRNDCLGDTSGVYSMPYKDYCISMLDKIDAVFRIHEDMPLRKLGYYDVMAFGYRDDADPYTAQHPELPPQLDLWEEVACCNRLFDPNGPLGGFTYVEIYDPAYWMEHNFLMSQSCFHPMYRMRSRNMLSAVNNTTIAVWVTKYAGIVPEAVSGIAVAAPSVHFGFPLWFFDRDAVDQIVEVIFTEWQILEGP